MVNDLLQGSTLYIAKISAILMEGTIPTAASSNIVSDSNSAIVEGKFVQKMFLICYHAILQNLKNQQRSNVLTHIQLTQLALE